MTLEKSTLENINAYKDDIITILNTQVQMLDKIEKDILVQEEKLRIDNNILDREVSENETKKNPVRILDIAKSKIYKKTLESEITKFKQFDVILAVVGTVKAGKSTTINAIVGRELLPNRNRPMTSIPTLICHNENQAIPKLTFDDTPLNEYLKQLRAYFNGGIPESIKLEFPILSQFLENKNILFKSSYTTENDIVEFLEMLNDLVRLPARISELDSTTKFVFPYDAYSSLSSLPIIEIAFNIEKSATNEGRFMLLDTAGINEKNIVTRNMLEKQLREQLGQSSAILWVLDYTQLNSEAEEKVAYEIASIPTVDATRSFAFVNKFDQENANADDAEQTINHVYNGLLQGRVKKNHIYPVSAQSAYLANRMKSHLHLNGNTAPRFEKKTWVEDFAKDTFGKRAEQKYNSAELQEIQQGIDDLYEDSQMAQPMSEVINKMQKNAPIIAIQSALAGSKAVFKDLENFFSIRGHFAVQEQMTQAEIEMLSDDVEALKNQIQELTTLQEQTVKALEENTKIKFEEVRELLSNLQEMTALSIQSIFNPDKTIAKEYLEEIKRKSFKFFIDDAKYFEETEKFINIQLKNQSSANELIFSSEDESDAVIKQIQESSSKLFKTVVEKIAISQNNLVANIKKDTDMVGKKGEEILILVSEAFKNKDINLTYGFEPRNDLQELTEITYNSDISPKKTEHTIPVFVNIVVTHI